MNLPKDFEKNMQDLLGSDYQNYLDSFSKGKKSGFRINYNYIDLEKFKKTAEFPFEVLDEEEGLCLLKGFDKIGSTLSHHLGLVYSQEPSSALPALCLEIKEGESVLDLCSSPGGKASQILQKNKTGEVVLNEVNKSRANILLSNIERQGFKNAVILNMTPEKLAEVFPNHFDKILVDAPCSGEGMFRKDPETRTEWNNASVFSCHERQLNILHYADKMLKENGVIVYSTCTLNIIENEKTISEFCKNYGYKTLETSEKVISKTRQGFAYEGDNETCKARRCFPQDDYGEGQFMAKIKKISPNNEADCVKFNKNALDLSKNDLKSANLLLKECIGRENLPLYKVGNKIFIYDKDVYGSENIILFGVCLGEINKNRIVPHHQFFKTYYNEFINVLDLKRGDDKISKYIHGEEIETDLSGYVCVTVDRVPLGGGKASGGRLKNYYPKGLRKN